MEPSQPPNRRNRPFPRLLPPAPEHTKLPSLPAPNLRCSPSLSGPGAQGPGSHVDPAASPSTRPRAACLPLPSLPSAHEGNTLINSFNAGQVNTMTIFTMHLPCVYAHVMVLWATLQSGGPEGVSVESHNCKITQCSSRLRNSQRQHVVRQKVFFPPKN